METLGSGRPLTGLLGNAAGMFPDALLYSPALESENQFTRVLAQICALLIQP